MKEYLAKVNGCYRIIENHEIVSGRIEVPEGAEIYAYWPINNEFNFHSGKSYFEDGSWHPCAWTVDEIKSGEAEAELLWQRHPENQESLDDVKWFEGDLKEADAVNQPNHYANFSIECIDAMQAMLSKDEFVGYLRGNIFKYNWRYKLKNGIEDLKKAQWYQAKLIEVEENE